MAARFIAFCAGVLLAGGGSAQEAASSNVESVVAAANALLGTLGNAPGPTESILGYDRRARLVLDFDDPAKQQWAYWPTQRAGLPLQLMSAEQRRLVHDLLLTTLSSKGHSKIINIMQLEDILEVLDES